MKPNIKARAHYNLVVIYGYSGRYNEGIKELEKADEINHEEIFLKEIEKIKRFEKDAKKLKLL